MLRIRPAQALAARQGVILLVVIALLTLFAVVGITFVIYAQAEASSMRVARQGDNVANPDADPEVLFNYFLSQLIYDTNNPLSSMQNWSMGRNLYGMAGNTVAFNGTGRLNNGLFGAVNYAVYPRSPDSDGAPNPPYTYPDSNCLFLAAVRANGEVLVPSFYRGHDKTYDWGVGNLRAPYNQIGPPEDGFADVKNLANSPGILEIDKDTGAVAHTPNDSFWVDFGFPVMRAANGQKYKPLFAALIQDLDNRINLNVHGNLLGGGARQPTRYSTSHQGWSPGEVNLSPVLVPSEAQSILRSPIVAQVPGRYDPNHWNTPPAPIGSNNKLKYGYAPGGHFYCSTNLDAYSNTASALTLPTKGSNFSFPRLGGAYNHGWYTGGDDYFNPMLYNVFDPTQSFYWFGSPGTYNRLQFKPFPASDLEALLRYGDTGSPALTSELFMLCPQSFSTYNYGRARQLVTTHSFDLSVPGFMPWIWAPTISQYTLPGPVNNTPGYPTAPQIPFPTLTTTTASPNSGEFGANWNGVSQASVQQLLKRIDLNRGFVDYQLSSNLQCTNYPTALQNRQLMCQEIFNLLIAVTGAGATIGNNGVAVLPSATKIIAPVGSQQYDALRWLAQLAVNILDFVNFPQPRQPGVTPAPDDIMTCFNWNPAQKTSIQNGWVFGTVLPRLVVNEAYIEIDNNPNDPGSQRTPPQATQPYDVNCWVELHNPFASDTGQGRVGANAAIPTPLQGTAQLYVPTSGPPATITNPKQAYPIYRLLIAQNIDAGQSQAQTMAQNSNVLGLPQSLKCVMDQFSQNANTRTVAPNYRNGQVNPGTQGGNQGFYVAGPTAQFPGKVPLKVTSQAGDKPLDPLFTTDQLLMNAGVSGILNPNSMHYTQPLGTNLKVQNLTHTIALQRLACPYLPPNFTPGPSFNPYVTVDYVLNVPTTEGRTATSQPMPNNVPMPPAPPVAQRYSVGRNQPYAADGTQLVQQLKNYQPSYNNYTGGKTSTKSPQNTFFYPNVQGPAGFAYDWLMFANRPLVSPIELLQVSGYKPHMLTQMFMLGGINKVSSSINPWPNNGGPPQNPNKFQHRAPWLGAVSPTVQGLSGDQIPAGALQLDNNAAKPPVFSTSTMIYRALEFFEAGLRPQWTAPGARTPGKININTIWDLETWQALCDQQPINFFTQQAVQDLYYAMYLSRTPAKSPNGLTFLPGPNDVPFVSLAAPFSPTGGQYNRGNTIPYLPYGIQNTLLRPDLRGLMPVLKPKTPNDGLGNVGRPDFSVNPLKLLLEPSISTQQVNVWNTPPTYPKTPELLSSASSTPGGIGHPYLRMELLNKIFNSVTTRSNVFAVWLTVGFFEVTNDAKADAVPMLGLEINKLEGRNIRHRMFAVIDRTKLSIAYNPVTHKPVLLQPANPTAGVYQNQYLQGPRAFFINSLSPVNQPGKATVSVPANITALNYYEDATWSIQQGMPLAIDAGPNQEIVTVTGVSGNSFTAAFTKPHPVGFAVTGACGWSIGMNVPVLGNPGPQPYLDARNPRYQGVVRYFSIIE